MGEIGRWLWLWRKLQLVGQCLIMPCIVCLMLLQVRLQQSMRSAFWKGHACYRIDRLNWTPLPFEVKKSPSIPNKRYLHSAVVHQQRLYILGGIDNDSDFGDSKLYCLDLASLKWTTIQGKNYCQSRNGHACALFRNELYFFGGSQHHSNPTNDFFKFTPHSAAWTHLEPEGPAPAQRELALLVPVNDQYILLYGGIDILEDKIFDDAFLFRHEQWQKLAVNGGPSERIKMGASVCGRRIFFFGGEGPSELGGNLFNDLFEAAIDEFQLVVTFKEVACRAGKAPLARTAHGMVGISDRFLLVYGGEGDGCILGDIWIYDTEEMQWSEIETLFGTLTPRYEFSISLHRNELLIFGGLNEQHAVLSDLVKLEFLQETQPQSQICQQCQQQLQQPPSKQPCITEPMLSSGFYHNLAMEIAFPFRAIEMICEVAEELRAEWIKIYSSKTIEEFDYMTFEFEAPNQMHSSFFLSTDSEYPNEARLLHNLKVAALRLGRTFLYVEASEHERRVFLLSADSKYAPNFEQSLVQYSYIERLDGGLQYGLSFGDKQAICNVLRSQVEEPFTLLSRTSGSLLAVFQINILPTVEKAYYYELIFYSQPDCDVRLYHNERKSELLESLGYGLTTLPDFSLRSYLQLSKRTRSIRTYINHDIAPVALQDYLEHLRSQEQVGVLEQIQLGEFSSTLVERCVVLRCTEGQWVAGNQGILVYCGNYLIDRHDCRLGQLLPDKFYKKKYSKRRNLFQFAGVLLLSPALKLNRTCTRPANSFKYNEILSELVGKLKQRKGEEENEFSQLYNRLILGKESSKKLKRDP